MHWPLIACKTQTILIETRHEKYEPHTTSARAQVHNALKPNLHRNWICQMFTTHNIQISNLRETHFIRPRARSALLNLIHLSLTTNYFFSENLAFPCVLLVNIANALHLVSMAGSLDDSNKHKPNKQQTVIFEENFKNWMKTKIG